MPNIYNSIYGQYIVDFIAMKKSLGFKYETERSALRQFDKLCTQRKETEVGVTRELWETWIKLRPNESSSYRYHRGAVMVQLSLYLNKLGIRSLIPRLPPNKQDYIPYVFSRNQVTSFFQAADQMATVKKNMNSIIFSLPCLWRLLYGTGVRISEALALQEKDVNTDDRYLVVRDVKNGLERLVPISQSLSEVCREYRLHKNKLPIQSSQTTPFFVSLNGMGCNRDAVYRWFRKTLVKAGILRCENGPVVHSFRHTFSVHSLAMLAESGEDLYCSLPILSSYLGHQNLESTNDYVRLTAEMYPGLVKDMGSMSQNVFPKFTDYGTD